MELPHVLRAVTTPAGAEAARLVERVELALSALDRILGPDADAAPPKAVAAAEPPSAGSSDEPSPAGQAGDRDPSLVERLLPGQIRKRRLLARARADLVRRLDAAARAAALEGLQTGMAEIERLNAACQARARSAHARAARAIAAAEQLRERLDPPAHGELARLAGLRRELLAQLPSGTA